MVIAAGVAGAAALLVAGCHKKDNAVASDAAAASDTSAAGLGTTGASASPAGGAG